MPVPLANAAAVVLAGGFGTRVRHLLPDLPKPMAPVCGRPFLEWVVRHLAHQGIRQVVLSTGHLSGKIEAHFAAQPIPGVDVTCACETEPLGTGGGFLNAVQLSGLKPDAWLVLNGDSLAFAGLAALAAALGQPGTAACLAGVEVDDASRFGTLRLDANNRLLSFDEKRPGRGIINAGMYLFRADTVRGFPSTLPLSFEKDVFPALLAHGSPLQVCVSRAPFLDIGTPESLPQAAAFIERNRNQFA